MGLTRYQLNQMLNSALLQQPKTNSASGASGASNVSGTSNASNSSGASSISGASSASGSVTVPEKLSKLLDKYLSDGCTREEIISVLNELKINYTIDNQKVKFNFNNKNYTLAYTVTTEEVQAAQVEIETAKQNLNEEIDKDFSFGLDETEPQKYPTNLTFEHMQQMYEIFLSSKTTPDGAVSYDRQNIEYYLVKNGINANIDELYEVFEKAFDLEKNGGMMSGQHMRLITLNNFVETHQTTEKEPPKKHVTNLTIENVKEMYEILSNATGVVPVGIHGAYKVVGGTDHILYEQIQRYMEKNGIQCSEVESFLRELHSRDYISPPSRLSEESKQKFITEFVMNHLVESDISMQRTNITGPDGIFQPQTESAKFVPDTSAISNVNADLSTFCTVDYRKLNVNSSSYSTVDKGFWNNALDELSKLKEQMHSFIKKELEARGQKYDKNIIENILNNLMTESLNDVLQKCGYPLTTDEILEKNLIGNEHKTNFTMSELVNLFAEKVNKEINKQNGFQEESYAQNIQERILNTADYLLDYDTQLLKSILAGLTLEDGGNGMGETVCRTASTAENIIDLYMDKVLKFEFKEKYAEKYNLTDAMIDDALKGFKNMIMGSLDSMVITSGVNKGKYNLELIIQKLEEYAVIYEVPASDDTVTVKKEQTAQAEIDCEAAQIEYDSIQAEMDAVKKIIDTDIERTFRTFSG